MKIFYVNGVARSGKDTFVNTVKENYSRVHNISSVDKVKEICVSVFGWDGNKDDKGRALLSDIKSAWTKYNDGPAMEMKAYVDEVKRKEKFEKHSSENIIFIMVREATEIAKMKNMMGGLSIVIERPGITACQTEKNFLKDNKGFKYDITIVNDSDEDTFKKKSIETIAQYIR